MRGPIAAPARGARSRLRLKRAVHLIALLAVSPLLGLQALASATGRADPAFATLTQLLSLVPGRGGGWLRAAFLSRAAGGHWECAVGFLTVFSHRGVELGRRVSIGAQCNIGLCRIGSHTLLGSGVHVLSGSRQHGTDRVDVPIQAQPGRFEKIRIGEGCWIGNQATVLADIGDGCVVAAAAVVTRAVPPRTVVAGNPARVLRER